MFSFPSYAEALWKVSNKSRFMVPFKLNPPQQVIWAAIKSQIDAGLPIRIRVLKARQQGSSLFCQNFCLHWTITKRSHQCLSIANRLDLPQQWIRQLKRLLRQLKGQVSNPPRASASNKAELYFEGLDGSRYMIGSALGETPGMGDTLNGVHCSEIASWANPDGILTDLLPAIPPTADTFIIQESTGRAMGDWWFCRYYEGKEPESEYISVFLPWYLSPEYDRDLLEDRDDSDPNKKNRYTWHDLGELNKDEVSTLAYAQRYQIAISHLYKMPNVTPGQMAWRRVQLRDYFHGDKELFANQYPACEMESFLSEGLNIFTPEQVRMARTTQRPSVQRYDISFSDWHPRTIKLHPNDSGEMHTWEEVDPRYHYVIGADCQWGESGEADYDVLYVQCLETDRVVAKVKGRYDLALWGKIIAGVGFHYNKALVAPERNAQAADGVMPLLLKVSSEWRYPNIYVRSDKMGIRISGPKGYGWLTDKRTKMELITYAKTVTLEDGFDWCDEDAVDQMQSYIRDEKGKMTAPKGTKDDDLMARQITAYVSHMVKPQYEGTLCIEQEKPEFRPWGTHVNDRMRWMADRDSSDYEELDLEE